jgi:hypothetical protein
VSVKDEKERRTVTGGNRLLIHVIGPSIAIARGSIECGGPADECFCFANGYSQRLGKRVARGEERWSGRGVVKRSGSRCNEYDHSWTFVAFGIG